MGILSVGSDFFGLDIGTTAIRVVQMRGTHNKVVVAYGSLPIDPRLSQSEANADQQKLMDAIRTVVSQSGISTANVAVGLPSQKVFSTVVDVDRLSPAELDKSIRFQADSLIPTPLLESKIDWALLGDSPKEASKVELLLSSVSNSFIEQRLDMLESMGLNVVAFEPDSLAITRSLLMREQTVPTLILDMGDLATDLVIVLNDAPRLIRNIPVGIDGIVKAAAQNLNIDLAQAQQFVFKFGVSKDKLEGQVHGAIENTIELLMTEIEKSIKFFNARYPDKNIERIVVTGGVSIIPEFPLAIANKFGLNTEIGNPWQNATYPSDKQNDLLALSSRFSVACGLAERQES